MARNETVTLPALSEGRVYISVAEALAVKLGCGVGLRTFHPGDHTEAIRDGTYAYGLRQCGGDGGALGKDASDADKKAGVTARCDAIDAGTHAYGAGGGGSRLSTLVVVMREKVAAAMVGLGTKKVDADKAIRADIEAAYMTVAVAVAATIPDSTPKAVFDIMWPKIEAESKAEAARRDKSVGTISLDESTRAAILAAATLPMATPKGPPAKKAA